MLNKNTNTDNPETISARLTKGKEIKRKNLRSICIVLCAVTALALAFEIGINIYINFIVTHIGESASIAIIGGSDGPTTVLITGSTDRSFFAVTFLILIASIAGIRLTKKRN